MFSKLITSGRLSIKMKLILILSLILISGLLLSNYFNYKASQKSVRENLVNGLLPLARDNIYSEIRAKFIRPMNIASSIAYDTFVIDWAITGEGNPEKITRYLKSIRDRYDFFTTYFISSKTKRYYHYKGISKIISRNDPHDEWYFRFINSGQEYNLEIDTNQAEKNILTIFINYRVHDYNRNLIGVAGVGIKMEKVTALLRSYKDKYESVVYIVNQSGIVQAHPNDKLTEQADINKLKGLKDIAAAVLSSNQDPAMYEFKRNKEHILLSVRFIPEFKWFLFVEIDENSKMSNIMKGIAVNLIFGILTTLIVIGISIFFINHYQSQLEYMAVTDALTGANNRREFDIQFRKAVYNFNRNGIPFSIIIFDIDHFKSINDTMGHITGDTSIKAIASIAKSGMRLTDVLVRWGGDEFIIISQGDEDSAMFVAERIRKGVEKSSFFSKHEENDNKHNITISCGVSGFRKGDTLDSILARADSALYRAKSEGRNMIFKG
jgi:diguanylate cyclase (GGDEF)-like protein